MAEFKDSSDNMMVGTLVACAFMGAALVAMMDSRNDDEPLPEPPAQVEKSNITTDKQRQDLQFP